MAYEIPLFSITLKAAADLSAHQYKFVKLDSNGDAAAIAQETDVPIGVLQEKPAAAGRACQVMVIGVSKLQGDADLAKGNAITTSADGQAQAAKGTCYTVGQVLEDNSAAGGLLTAIINCAAPILKA